MEIPDFMRSKHEALSQQEEAQSRKAVMKRTKSRFNPFSLYQIFEMAAGSSRSTNGNLGDMNRYQRFVKYEKKRYGYAKVAASGGGARERERRRIGGFATLHRA